MSNPPTQTTSDSPQPVKDIVAHAMAYAMQEQRRWEQKGNNTFYPNLQADIANYAKEIEVRIVAERAEAENVGRIKELEAGDILPEIAFEIGSEWFVQGVKVPKYLARKISDAAKERRKKLLATLTQQEGSLPS